MWVVAISAAMSKPLLSVLSGTPSSTPPIWLMRQAGRYLPEYMALRAKEPDFIRFCLNTDLTTEATLQPIRRYGFDASILFADILLLPWAAGQKVWFEKNHGPRLDPLSPDMLDRLDFAGATTRLSPVYETVRRLRQELPESCTLIGFAGAPWTVATYMLAGGKDPLRWEARLAAWKDAPFVDALLERLAVATADYLMAQIEAGAEVVKLFDSWSDALPETLFRRVVIMPTQRIVESLHKRAPHIPVMGFPRGAAGLSVQYVQQTGVRALALDISQAEHHLVSLLPRDLPLQGGFDPALLTAGGPMMAEEVDRLLALMQDRPYIFNLGHGISKDTPPEHVQELINLIRQRD